MTGSSTAYHLSKAGVPVVLIERDEIGHGMTSRSTAVVRTHYSNEIVAKMALYSLKILRDFSSIGNSGFTECGMLILGSRNFRSAIEANVRMLKNVGVNELVLSKSEAQKSFPYLDLEDCSEEGYIALEPESGYADPVATAGLYAARARELGAEIILRNGVQRLEAKDGKMSSVILADGFENRLRQGNTLHKCLDQQPSFKERCRRRQSPTHEGGPSSRSCLQAPCRLSGKKVVVSDYYNKAYYKSEGQSLLFGGSIDASIDDRTVDPDNAPSDVPFEDISDYSERISKRIPAMRNAEFHSACTSGMYDITPDEHPIIDDLSTSLGIQGLYCCVGLSGHGFKLCRLSE